MNEFTANELIEAENEIKAGYDPHCYADCSALYRELQKLIDGLPDDATKLVIEMEACERPTITITRGIGATGATVEAKLFRIGKPDDPS